MDNKILVQNRQIATNARRNEKSGEENTQEVVESKRCECCGKVLPLDKFLVSRKGNLFKICRDCATAKKVASYKHNRNVKKQEEQERQTELSKFTPRELIAELRLRGYTGELKYTNVIKL